MTSIQLDQSLDLSGAVVPSRRFLEIEATDEEFIVSFGSGIRQVSTVWSHNVYELEQLAIGLRYVAQTELPKLSLPSQDLLIGQTAHLWPALRLQLGHPGIGKHEGLGATVYASVRTTRRVRRVEEHVETRSEDGLSFERVDQKYYVRRRVARKLIDLVVVNAEGSSQGTFDPKEIRQFAQDALEMARPLANIHFPDGD